MADLVRSSFSARNSAVKVAPIPATISSKPLKLGCYQSAFCAIRTDPASNAFHRRKRTEGKRHHQALIALARRRSNVPFAPLRTRQPY